MDALPEFFDAGDVDNVLGMVIFDLVGQYRVATVVGVLIIGREKRLAKRTVTREKRLAAQ